MPNEYADEAANGVNSTTTQSELHIEQIKLDEAREVFNRRKEMYKISNCLIQFLTGAVILLITGAVILVVMNSNSLSEIKDIWHIYLISVLALSTLLSGMIYLSKSTWSDKKDDAPTDLTSVLTKLIDVFSKKQQ